ncbi:hypothetical protein CBR_g20040 [Chara braunii]|uniref:Uncharacterized protein n=1 Tax=Chara braunii TaxID=69332 RepID=A0A388KZC6_CHABU|nr:hypothetical protein CBR_g20040 [Chara braunii]|eukprot:GBG75410.1 hypothetical protein CBR_g20040 [Chara braunii]
MCLFEGFGAGAANTPFYNDLRRQGGFVLGREFFDLLEDKDIALDVPCEVGPDLEMSTPLQLCGGCESSGAAGEGGDLGSGEATHVQREDARGQFDDSEDEATPRPPFSASRERDRSVLSILGVRQEVAADPGEEAVQCGSDLEPGEGHGVDDKAVGGKGVEGTPQKRREDCQEDVVGSLKKQKTRTPKTTGEKRKGRGVEEDHPGSKRPASKQKQPASGPSTTRPAIDVDAGYFLEYKDGVRTRREFEISPAQIVDLREWEDLYNQRSLDPVLVGMIKEAMRYAFENKEQTYELPFFKLAPLGLQKPTPGIKAQRLNPEKWKDELAGEYYYYAVCGQHNAAAARSLLGSEVAKKYNFEWWPARMLYFSNDDFEGYFLLSSQDNKKDLKTPPRQLKLSMIDIRWQWKHDGCPRAVTGNPSGKQDQVQAWRKFCTTALHKAPHNSLWILADQKEEEAVKKQNAALRSYFPLAMAGENVWKLTVEFFEKWETGRLLSHDGAKWIVKKKKVKNVKPGVAYIHNDKLGRTEVVYNVPVDPPNKKGKKEKEEGDWFVQVPALNAHLFRKFESQGLDDELWDNSRKHVSDSALFKDCPPYMGCDQDNSIEVTEKLAGHKKLSVDWRNKILSVLNGSRLKSRKVALAEGIVHIKWKDTGVTSIASFANNPLEADMRGAELKAAVAATKSHTFVLDLCEPGSVYGDMKRNPIQFVGLLDFLGKKGEGVVFLGKPHARSVWDLLKAGRHVVAMKGNAELLQFTMQVVKSEVNSGGHNCEFMVVKPTRDKVGSNKTDMWFKLSKRKRNKIYDFLFLQTRPRKDSDADSGGGAPGSGGDGGGGTGGGKGIPTSGERGSHGRNTTAGGSGGVAGFAVDRPPSTGTWPDHTTQCADLPTSSVGSARDTLAALLALESHSGGKLKSVGIRTTSAEEPPERSGMQSRSGSGEPSKDPEIGSIAARDGNVGKVSPEQERRPQGLQREAASTGSGDTETTKSAEIRTSSGGGCRPGIVVSLRGAACMEMEGRSSGFNTGTAEGDEFRGREVGKKMEERRGALEGEEEGEKEGEEEEEGEEAGETEVLNLLEGREGAGSGDDEVEHSEDDAGSGKSSDEFGQL